MMWSVAVNATLGFLMAVTLIFTLGDIDSLFESVTRQPFIQVFYNATHSLGGTNAMTALVIILLASCCVSEVATASRQLWSFARDGGLPGSNWLLRVSYDCNQPSVDTDTLSGDSWMEYSAACGLSQLRRELSSILHQHWLCHSTQRH
jgi:choline transport protein